MKSNSLGDIPADAVQANAVAVSGTTPIGPLYTPCINYDEVSYQLVTTGTVAGTWLIEASNDYVPALGQPGQLANAGHWIDVTARFKDPGGFAPTNPTGSPTSEMVDATVRYNWLRITFTPASGAGNVTVARCAKGTR